MPEQVTIELELDERRVPVRVHRVAAVRSPHTGQDVAELHGFADTTDGAVHSWLSRVLSEAGDQVVRSAEPYEGIGRWRVSWNSYAETGSTHTYTLILREEEDLGLQALVLNGVELHPYEYREQFSGTDLTIWAKLAGTRAAVLRLRTMLESHRSFPVVRLGIDQRPRPMRFGVAEWSVHDDQIKYRIVLVDRAADPAEHPELARIEEANSRAGLAFYMNFVERLAVLLERRGVLPAEEIQAARNAAREELGPSRREFWRVPDVDAL